MELVWICLVVVTYVMLLCAFLVYRKIKSLEEYVDREYERFSIRVDRLSDHMYELKQKVDVVPKVETKLITCTEWKPISERDMNKKFQRVCEAYDDFWVQFKESVAELKELKDDVERHEDFITAINMKIDGAYKKLDRLEQQVSTLKKKNNENIKEE